MLQLYEGILIRLPPLNMPQLNRLLCTPDREALEEQFGTVENCCATVNNYKEVALG